MFVVWHTMDPKTAAQIGGGGNITHAKSKCRDCISFAKAWRNLTVYVAENVEELIKNTLISNHSFPYNYS